MSNFSLALDPEEALEAAFDRHLDSVARMPAVFRRQMMRQWLAAGKGPESPNVVPTVVPGAVTWWRNPIQLIAVEPTVRGWIVVLYHKGARSQSTGFFSDQSSAISAGERCYGRLRPA